MVKITFHYRYRKQIIVGTSISIILIISIILLIIYYPKIFSKKKDIVLQSNPKETLEKKEELTEDLKYKVDIKGQVLTPGIYEMSPSSRVIDVIEKAGGLTKDANTTVLNLSKKIKDEMVIIVYSNSEINEFLKTKEKEEYLMQQCIQKDENSLKNDACICENTTTSVSEKISINKATLEQLMTLTGIGESKAQDIITYREKNGPFKKIDDLKNVTGIGESVFDKIKENITL